MDVERARTFLLTLPHVVETMQWGTNLVFWVGDKAIGGKMFALIDLDADLSGSVIRAGVVSFVAGKERAAELLEIAGMFPAPYFARIGWVAAERWGALRSGEWESEFQAAHQLTLVKLPLKVTRLLALPEAELAALVEGRRMRLAAKGTGTSAVPAGSSTRKS